MQYKNNGIGAPTYGGTFAAVWPILYTPFLPLSITEYTFFKINASLN
jgi:hypothetical protein